MNEKDLSVAIISGGSALMGILIKIIWDRLKRDKEDQSDKYEKLTNALGVLTIAVTELKVEMSHVKKGISLVEELHRDVQKMGAKLRQTTKGEPKSDP